jgi:hypothetical protein
MFTAPRKLEGIKYKITKMKLKMNNEYKTRCLTDSIKYNTVDGIFNWGADNAYPQLIKKALLTLVLQLNTTNGFKRKIYIW